MVVNNVINLPSMTGNGTTYKNGDDWGMVQMALFYPHYWKKAPVEETPMRVGFRLRASEGLVV